MYLRCPECKSRYEISAARIPDGGARVRCPRCRTVFHVSRPLNGNGGDPFDDEELPRFANGDGHGEARVGGGVGAGADVLGSAGAAGGGAEGAGDGEPSRAGGGGEGSGFGGDVAGPATMSGEAPVADGAAGHGAEVSAATQAMSSAGSPAGATFEPSRRIEPVAPTPAGTPAAIRIPAARPVVPGAAVDSATARRIARAIVSDLASARRGQRDDAEPDGRVLSTLGPVIAEAWDDYRRRVGDRMARDTPHFREAVNEFLGLGEPLL